MEEDKEKTKYRKKRQRKRHRKKVGKTILIVLAIAVLFVAAFLVTMKICDPDFELNSIIPTDKAQEVVQFVKEDILKQTTTTTAPTTKPTTTRPPNYDYEDFSDFDFDTSLQGNQVGNLLNNTSGAVTFSSSYIYYSIDSSGLYRFEPNEETNAQVKVGSYNYKYLNVLGDYIYFVDTDSNSLIKTKNSGGGDNTAVAENISFAYLYNDKIYFIGTDNTVGYITTSDLSKTVLYTAGDGKELDFVGISLSRVFFTQFDNTTKKYSYITVSLTDESDCQYFHDDTDEGEIVNMQLEAGYFYYYEKQSDGSYDLIRQKFGSEKTVILLEDCSMTDYPVIYRNRLYYTVLDGEMLRAMELNMNSSETKVMLSMGGADSTATAGVAFGYQYIFLFGKATADENTRYLGSNIYTSSSNENRLTFSDGSWHY